MYQAIIKKLTHKLPNHETDILNIKSEITIKKSIDFNPYPIKYIGNIANYAGCLNIVNLYSNFFTIDFYQQ